MHTEQKVWSYWNIRQQNYLNYPTFTEQFVITWLFFGPCPLVGVPFLGAPVRPNMLNMPKSASATLGLLYDRGLSHLLHEELYWLDVPQRVQFKLCAIVHSDMQSRAPYSTWWNDLRSVSCHHQLFVPRHRRSMFGRRAFSLAGPMTWNSLLDVRSSWFDTLWCD